MKDFPSRERLMEMPLSYLRNLDVDTPGEEVIVQEVIAARATELLPTGHDAVISGSLDIGTPEQEAEIQAMLDRKRGLLQQLIASRPGATTYVGSPIIDASTIADSSPDAPAEAPAETEGQPVTAPSPEPTPELTPTAPDLPQEPDAAPSTEATVGVCAICSGKRGHHRKGCSLYKK